jgi:hypothetical protein
MRNPFKRDKDNRGEGGTDRTPSIDRPTYVVSYTDENGGKVELQTYSAVSADEIKRQHPDAKITPTRHQ